MADHDPKVFQRPSDTTEGIHYSWQTGGIHMFFYTDYGEIGPYVAEVGESECAT